MSVWVVLVFLSVTHPGDRREVLLDEPQTLSFCGVAAQQEAARWLEDHPGWRYDRARCTPGKEPPAVNNRGEV